MPDTAAVVHAIARGELSRAQLLRRGRQTALARRLLLEMTVTDDVAPFSPEARLRSRWILERVFIRIRSDNADDLSQARHDLEELRKRTTADVITRATRATAQFTVDGESGANLLNDIAIAYSRLGEPAIAIEIARELQRHAQLHNQKLLETIQIHNIAMRQTKFGFTKRLVGDVSGADLLLHHAVEGHEAALRRRPQASTAAAESARLLSSVNLLRARSERLLIDPRQRDISSDLNVIYDGMRDCFERSRKNPTTTPLSIVVRASYLGMVKLELARIAARNRDHPAAERLAMLGRCLMKPAHDMHEMDVDEPIDVALRYADACALTADAAEAAATLRETVWRLKLLRGPSSPVVTAVEYRLDRLPKIELQ